MAKKRKRLDQAYRHTAPDTSQPASPVGQLMEYYRNYGYGPEQNYFDWSALYGPSQQSGVPGQRSPVIVNDQQPRVNATPQAGVTGQPPPPTAGFDHPQTQDWYNTPEGQDAWYLNRAKG